MSNATLLPATADSLARVHTAEAMGLLVQVVRGDVPGAKANDRIRAAETILDRGHGKAVQAVISVPSRQRVAAQLAAMSTEDLLRIAKRGEGGRKGGPNARGEGAGPIPETADPNAQCDGYVADPSVQGDSGTWPNTEYPLAPFKGSTRDAIDAEFTEEVDPLS